MVRINPFLILLFFLSSSLLAQRVDTSTLNGLVVSNNGEFPGRKVILTPYNNIEETYEANINSDGSFIFKVPVSDISSYQLTYCGYAKSILFTKNELSAGFLIEVEDGRPSKMFISNSYENAAYEILRTSLLSVKESFAGFGKCDADNNAKWPAVFKKYNLGLAEVSAQYPNTFTVKSLIPMAKFPEFKSGDLSVSFVRQHYFDSVDICDDLLFKTSDIAYKIINYLDCFADTTPAGRISFINNMFNKAKGNIEVKKRIGLALYNIFSQQNRENYLVSYGQWLEFQPWAKNDLPAILSRLELASKVLPGSHAPDIVAIDVNGKNQHLSDQTKSNKLTMVLFWSSECSHCRESLPEFKELYTAYHSMGYNIFSVSLDEDKMSWIDFLKQNPVPWINVYAGANSEAANNYYVQATPSVAFIDQNGIVIKRFMDTKDIAYYIKKIL